MHRTNEVRSLSLFKPSGEPIGRLSSIFYAFTVFPEDTRSREQALAIFEIEERDYWS